MQLCQEIGRWITENVERPVERFFEQAQKVCDEVRTWVEHNVSEPITRYRDEVEEHCEEQPCKKWCLCCNKWLCWLVTIVVSFIEWVVTVVGEWLVNIICNIIITIIKTVVMIIIQLLKWIVLFVICFLEALCPILLLTGALALLTLLLAIAALGAPALAAAAAPIIPIALAVVLTTFFMVLFLCRMDRCRIVNAVGWALRWAILLGGIMAVLQRAPITAWVVTIYGGLIAALIIVLERGTCRLKSMRKLP